MFGDMISARWVAIAGLIIAGSACAACFLVVLVLGTAYGGQTVALRNPFAAPTPVRIVQPTSANAPVGNDNNSSSGGFNNSTNDNTNSGGFSGQATNVPQPNPNTAPLSGGDAANYLPRLNGYQTAQASSIQGAIDLIRATGGFGAQSADDGTTFQAQSVEAVLTSVIVSRLDDFIACYRRTGAVDARVYVSSDIATLLSGGVPPLGAVAVINQDRLRESLLDCTVEASGGLFSAQSANQPCGDFGTFSSGGDRFTYIYAGTTTNFCTDVEQYYSNLGG